MPYKYRSAIVSHKKFKENVNEIYTLFEKFNISENEFNELLYKLCLESKKTERLLYDLFLCMLIKNGFNDTHLLLLSKRLISRKCRSNHLMERLHYLSNYIME
jgi:hypothetical protein